MKAGRPQVITLTFVVLAVAMGAEAQLSLYPDTTRRLSVDESGEASAPPDTASVSLGVYELNKDLSKARDKVDETMSKLLDLASKLGIPKPALVTSALNLSPEFSSEEVPTFLGYEVTRSLDVELHDLTKLERRPA